MGPRYSALQPAPAPTPMRLLMRRLNTRAGMDSKRRHARCGIEQNYDADPSSCYGHCLFVLQCVLMFFSALGAAPNEVSQRQSDPTIHAAVRMPFGRKPPEASCSRGSHTLSRCIAAQPALPGASKSMDAHRRRTGNSYTQVMPPNHNFGGRRHSQIANRLLSNLSH